MVDDDDARLLTQLDGADWSLGERAIQSIRTAIAENRLIPGELYSVYKLARDLGISRSPVRDALLRLEELNLVEFIKNRGFRVIKPSVSDIAELFAVRLLLEPTAAARAARVRNDDAYVELLDALNAMDEEVKRNDEHRFLFHDQRLHTGILSLGGNRFARSVVDEIRNASRTIGVSTIENQRDLEDVYLEHSAIVKAIEDHDAAKAAELMDTHLRSTGRMLILKSDEAADTEELLRCWPPQLVRYDRD